MTKADVRVIMDKYKSACRMCYLLLWKEITTYGAFECPAMSLVTLLWKRMGARHSSNKGYMCAICMAQQKSHIYVILHTLFSDI